MGERYFSDDMISEMEAKLATIPGKADALAIAFVNSRFNSELATEHARQGFARRVWTMRRCIENVFSILPPETVGIPTRERLHDAQINIQAFFANAYGSIDNLAWVFVSERGLKLPRRQVGLRKTNTSVRNAVSSDFREYLEGIDEWLEYLVDYRDALAHRIPLYIPDARVRPDDVEKYNELAHALNEATIRGDADEYDKIWESQRWLLVYQPIMSHSITGSGQVAFHVQLIRDFLTVEEIAVKMLGELARPTSG